MFPKQQKIYRCIYKGQNVTDKDTVIYLINYNIALLENNSRSSADLFKPEAEYTNIKQIFRKPFLSLIKNKTRFQAGAKEVSIHKVIHNIHSSSIEIEFKRKLLKVFALRLKQWRGTYVHVHTQIRIQYTFSCPSFNVGFIQIFTARI